MGFLIEYDGDDTEILDFAVRHVAEKEWIARVTLRPSYDDGHTITSVADYLLSSVAQDGTVLLTLVEERDGELVPVVYSNGFRDTQRVHIHNIVELHIY